MQDARVRNRPSQNDRPNPATPQRRLKICPKERRETALGDDVFVGLRRKRVVNLRPPCPRHQRRPARRVRHRAKCLCNHLVNEMHRVGRIIPLDARMDDEKPRSTRRLQQRCHRRNPVRHQRRLQTQRRNAFRRLAIKPVRMAEVVLHIDHDEGGGLGVNGEVHGVALPALSCAMGFRFPRSRK